MGGRRKISILDTRQAEFELAFERLLDRRGGSSTSSQIADTVKSIIDSVRRDGDRALIDLTRSFDHLEVSEGAALELPRSRLDAARDALAPELTAALKSAHGRIASYHERQREQGFEFEDDDGTTLGQRVSPIRRCGIYVPGGLAAYPSSVLMTAVPARVAGVEDVIMVVPTPNGAVNDAVLAAALLAGVDRVFTIGGAQAVAALAYGTETVPAVDKIVGPGNAYVAEAKRQVFGDVGIDMIAGPSEVLIIADDSADARWIATDMFAQAEHDTEAQSILVTDSDDVLAGVARAIDDQQASMARADIIAESLANHGALIRVRNLAEAAAISDRVAPEHLEIMTRDADDVMRQVSHAGAIFVGRHSAEVLGDYCAGPSHVLPTSGTARFSSPLGVYDFQKRTSIIRASRKGAKKLAQTASVIATAEGLDAHAQSARLRLDQNA